VKHSIVRSSESRRKETMDSRTKEIDSQRASISCHDNNSLSSPLNHTMYIAASLCILLLLYVAASLCMLLLLFVQPIAFGVSFNLNLQSQSP